MTVSEYNRAVMEWSDGLYRFLYKSLRNEDESADLVQDAFEALWIHREKVENDKVKAWLFQVAYRKMIDQKRKKKVTEDIEIADRNPSNLGAEYNGLKPLIDKAIKRLTESQRSALMLRDYEGYDYKSIAEITGSSEAVVKINIFRARQKIKQFIGNLKKVL